MKLKDLRILHGIVKRLRKKHPEYIFKVYSETKFFYFISISEPECFANKKFIQNRDNVRNLHGRRLSKQLMFITHGQYIKKR